VVARFSRLHAYIDDSGTGDSEVFVLAGYIATEESWAAFSTDWQQLVNMKSRHYRQLSYFKMNEMRSDTELERCSWFYRVIEKHVTAAVSCAISVPGLVKAVKEFPWPPWIYNIQVLENPYYFAFKATTDKLAQHQHQLKIDQPVDFILTIKARRNGA